MGKTADLTVVQKTIIDTLHKEDKPQTFIAKEAGCSQSAVKRITAFMEFLPCIIFVNSQLECKMTYMSGGGASELTALKYLLAYFFITNSPNKYIYIYIYIHTHTD